MLKVTNSDFINILTSQKLYQLKRMEDDITGITKTQEYRHFERTAMK